MNAPDPVLVQIERFPSGSATDPRTLERLTALAWQGYTLSTVIHTDEPNPTDPPAGCHSIRYGMDYWIFTKIGGQS